MKSILNEDMPKCGDLNDMVLPLISIDEYTPKTGLESQIITIAFYTTDETASQDLRKFIERGTVENLDIEVSPNPDDENRWMLFVEVRRNNDLWKKLDNIVADIERLVGNALDWKVTIYGKPDLYTLCDVREQDLVELSVTRYAMDKLKRTKNNMMEDIAPYLSNALHDKITFSDDKLGFVYRTHLYEFTIETYDHYEKIITEESNREAIEVNHLSREVEMIKRILGESYYVNTTKTKIFIQRKDSDNILVLKKYG